MSYDDKSGGAGSGEASDAHTGDEQWNGRSNVSGNNKSKHASVPSFKPSELAHYNNAELDLIPLHGPSDLDKHRNSLGKVPQQGWRKCKRMSIVDAMQHMANSKNVGCRLQEGQLVVDVDPRHFIEGDDPLKRLGKDLGIDWWEYPIVNTGSGGKHIYMSMPAGVKLRNSIEGYEGIEFKALGRQVVTAGSVHPLTNKTYEWEMLAGTPGSMPPAPGCLVNFARRASAQKNSNSAGRFSAEQLEIMLSGLDPEDFADQQAWCDIMMSCHYATDGDGRQEFINWSTQDPQFSDHAQIIGGRWDSLDREKSVGAITERTLCRALIDLSRADLIPRDTAAEDFPEESDFKLGRVSDTQNPIAQLVEDMNNKFCAVLDSGDYSIYMTELDDLYDPPRHVMTRVNRAAFRHYHENELISIPDQKAKKNRADVWLQHPEMRKYPGIVLDPSNKPTDKLNLWQGWAVEAKKGDWSLMRELITEVLCGGDYKHSEYVIRWMAFMLQKPGIRPEVAIAFRGNEGTGKSTLGRALMRLSGRHGITVSSPKQLAGNFNAHLRSAVFVFADEALWPGNKEAEGTLKQLVTEPLISFEPKGKDTFLGRNHVHLMLASNEDWIVPAGKDARRFAVFDVLDTRRNDREFFGRLNRQMQAGGYAAMLHDLLTMDLGDWHPAREIPQTQALADQKLMSLDPANKFWMEVLEHGQIDLIDKAEWLSGPVTLRSERETLRADYDSFLKRNRIFSAKATNHALAKAGKNLGLEAVKLDRNQGRGWILPPLHEARKMFEKRIGSGRLFD